MPQPPDFVFHLDQKSAGLLGGILSAAVKGVSPEDRPLLERLCCCASNAYVRSLPVSPDQRQKDAIEQTRQARATRQPCEPFPQPATSHQRAAEFLARLAQSDSPYAAEARDLLEDWWQYTATPEQIAQVHATDELEIGACPVISPTEEDGFWIATWSWVSTDQEDDDTAKAA